MIIPIYLGSIIPYISQPTRVFFMSYHVKSLFRGFSKLKTTHFCHIPSHIYWHFCRDLHRDLFISYDFAFASSDFLGHTHIPILHIPYHGTNGYILLTFHWFIYCISNGFHVDKYTSHMDGMGYGYHWVPIHPSILSPTPVGRGCPPAPGKVSSDSVELESYREEI